MNKDPISLFLERANDQSQHISSGRVLLQESLVENTEESLKTFFPYLWNAISGNIQTIFPIFTNQDMKETAIIQDVCKNLTVKVYLNNMPQPNAYTLPLASGRLGMQALSMGLSAFFPLQVLYAVAGMSALDNFDGKASQDKVLFHNPSGIEVAAWETKGLKSMMDDRERIAVLLHEIGHWTRFQPLGMSMLFRVVATALPQIGLPFIILSIIKGRAAEYQADKFSANVGYSKEMSSALDKMYHARRTNISILGKIGDISRYITMAISNIIDEILPIATHPNLRKRLGNIGQPTVTKEDFNIENSDELYIIDEDAKEFLAKMVKSVLKPIDKLTAKYVEDLFPLVI